MINSYLSDNQMNEIVKRINRAVSAGVYEENETNGHAQKLRKDRMNSALKTYLGSIGFETVHLRITSTDECFFYNHTHGLTINIMKLGTFENAVRKNTHYLRDYTAINDSKEVGQMSMLFDKEYSTIKSIETADKNLSKLYNELGHSDVNVHFTILVEHVQSTLVSVEFCMLSGDLNRLDNVIKYVGPSYEETVIFTDDKVPTTSNPKRTLKLKGTPQRKANFVNSEKDSKDVNKKDAN